MLIFEMIFLFLFHIHTICQIRIYQCVVTPQALSTSENYKEAEELYRESLDIKKSLGDKQGIAQSLHQLGMIQQDQGNYKEAEELYRESLDIERSLGDKKGIAISLHQRGRIQEKQGIYKKAAEYYITSLSIFLELGSKC